MNAKKLWAICLLLVALQLNAQNSQHQTVNATMEKTTLIENNKKVIDHFFVALETQDFEKLKEIFTDKSKQINIYIPSGFPKSFDGVDEIYQQYSGLPAKFGQMKFPRTIYATEDPNLFFVVFTGDNHPLETSWYEKIAKEFNFSESSFVRFSEKKQTYVIRSFTAGGVEIRGAGHNLLGVVCELLMTGDPVFSRMGDRPFVIMKDREVYFEANMSGKLPVVGLRQSRASLGKMVPIQPLAEGLEVSPSAFHNELLPQVVATEVAHLIVPLIDMNALHSLTANKKILLQLSNEWGFQGVYCYALSPYSEHMASARFFNPLVGIDEDPATGSAAGPLAGFLHHHGLIRAGENYKLLQGEAMGRPSEIIVRVEENGIVVSGSSVLTMEGTLYL